MKGKKGFKRSTWEYLTFSLSFTHFIMHYKSLILQFITFYEFRILVYVSSSQKKRIHISLNSGATNSLTGWKEFFFAYFCVRKDENNMVSRFFCQFYAWLYGKSIIMRGDCALTCFPGRETEIMWDFCVAINVKLRFREWKLNFYKRILWNCLESTSEKWKVVYTIFGSFETCLITWFLSIFLQLTLIFLKLILIFFPVKLLTLYF